MPSITIRGIPDRLYRRLERRALENRRSLNSEIIACLAQTAGVPAFDPVNWLKEADRLRARLTVPPLSEAALRRAKSSGRP